MGKLMPYYNIKALIHEHDSECDSNRIVGCIFCDAGPKLCVLHHSVKKIDNAWYDTDVQNNIVISVADSEGAIRLILAKKSIHCSSLFSRHMLKLSLHFLLRAFLELQHDLAKQYWPVGIDSRLSTFRRQNTVKAIMHVLDIGHHFHAQTASNPLQQYPYAAFFPFSAIPTSARRMPVAPLRRAGGVSHSSKNTTFMSGRTRAPSGCLAI